MMTQQELLSSTSRTKTLTHTMKNYIFNNEETGEVWNVVASSQEEAEALLPEDADWDDSFALPVK